MLNFFGKKKISKNNNEQTIDESLFSDEEIDFIKDNILKKATIKTEETSSNNDNLEISQENKELVPTTNSVENNNIEIPDISGITTQNQGGTTNGEDMEKTINVKDVLAKIADFLSGQTSKETVADENSGKPVEENGEGMTQEEKDELLKVQEELKLANEKAEAEILAKTTLETHTKELQDQIDAMNAEKEEKAIKAEKENISQIVKNDLSFVDGTLEENAEKLFNIKSALGKDNAELFDFVIESLKKKSTEIENSLNPAGADIKKTDLISAEEKVDKLTAEKMSKNPKLTESVAYTEVLDENLELKKAIYSNIGKHSQETEETEE